VDNDAPRSLTSDTRDLIRRALQEDHTDNDVTTLAAVPPDTDTSARIMAREDGVLAGTHLLPFLFDELGGDINISSIDDGSSFDPGDAVVELQGDARALLTGERVALNFLQRLTGIATLTHAFVSRIDDLKADLVDTRKTTPGWRSLEKYAVRQGGGNNHRMHLADMAMIKENHITLINRHNRSLPDVITELEASVDVQVEVDRHQLLEDVLPSEPTLILIDNMSPEDTEQAVRTIRSYEQSHDTRILAEASGGIDLDSVRSYAMTGVDRISIGSITHSAPAVDLSMMLPG
jgi:nicotinate-nucleotide pyrophosphorylase (carboxylating)